MFARRFFLTLALAAVVFCQPAALASYAAGQGAKPPARTGEDASAAALRRARVVEVLRQTADESKGWANAEAAAAVQTQAADLLWDEDAASGRDVLVLAWETAGNVREPKRERSGYRNYSRRTAARGGVLLVAKRRDAPLADKWVEEMSLEKEADGEGGGRGVFDDRTQASAALLQMAMSVVEENPNAAADFAIGSLRDGVSFGLQGVLVALQAKSFDLSERVFRAALARVAASGLSDPNELLILNSYLYTPGRINAASVSADPTQRTIAVSRGGAVVTPAAQFKPALAAEFLRAAADLLLNAPAPAAMPDPQAAARAQIGAIQTLLRRIEQVAPEKAALLSARLQLLAADAQFSASPSPPPDDYVESRRGESAAEYNERRVDFLEKEAERQQSPLARDVAYAKAAAATEPEAYERGWRVAGKIKDDRLRADVTNWLTYRATLSLLKRGELARARSLAARDEDLAQRAVCLVVGAQKLVGEKDYPGAGEWLGEVRALMKKAPLDENWTKIALGVVAAYGKFDKAAALQTLGEAVRVMNQFPTDATRTDGAPPVQRFTGVVTSDVTHGTQGFGLNAAVAVFSPQDFESVYGVLREVETPEARGEAVLVLCQRFLLKEKARPAGGEKGARPKASL